MRETKTDKALPKASVNTEKALPETNESKEKKLPEVNKSENCILIGGELIEIKPTKVKYQRNRTANFYKVFDYYSLPEILSWEAGQFGIDDDRDGDTAVLEWLLAVFDGDQRIKKNYNELNTEDIETILKIFRRINNIDEKEEARKNLPREKITE